MEHYQFYRLPKLDDNKLVLNNKIISNSKFSQQYNIFCNELIKNIKNIDSKTMIYTNIYLRK